MGRWVSASPVHTVVKGQALPIAHLLIPKKFGCEMEFEEIEISCITGEVNKLVSRFALTLAISDGVLRFPPTILSQTTLPEEPVHGTGRGHIAISYKGRLVTEMFQGSHNQTIPSIRSGVPNLWAADRYWSGPVRNRVHSRR